jgi:ectoine hydroxylase-related dioxygenase (phytanoyl-CoA dioxygenase family)
LGLEANLAELDTYGLTVVEPAKVAPREFTERLLKCVLEIAGKRDALSGTGGEGRPGQYKGVGQLLYYLLFEDRIFEEALLNPTVLSLITYLLGDSCLLSSVTGMIKGQNAERSVLHTDNGMIPSPFPPYAQVANATWILTDYSRENGSLLFVPGSHRLCRHPSPSERDDESTMVAVEAPAGSLVVWHGNLWHGAFPKRTPGLRVNLIFLFCRVHCITQETYEDRIPREVLDRNPDRFAKLLGRHVANGWTHDGSDLLTAYRSPGEWMND